MPNFVSPGVYVIEKDISEYTPALNSSVVGIVGFASKGPIDEPTLITDQASLIRIFGEPSENIYGQGLEAALEILETTNSVYFIRAASAVNADASATVTLGACPAVIVSGPATSTAVGGSFGIGNSLYLEVQVYNNNGIAEYPSAKRFSIPAGTITSTEDGACQARALKKIIGGGLDSDAVGVFDDNTTTGTGSLGLSGAIVGRYAGSAAYMTLTSYSANTFDVTAGVSALVGIFHPSAGINYGMSGSPVSSITVYGATLRSSQSTLSSIGYVVESLYPGAGYNAGTTESGDTSGNSVTIRALGGGNFFIDVNDNGSVVENYKAHLFASGSFIEDVINTGETNPISEYIKGNIFSDQADEASVTKLNNFASMVSSLTGQTQIVGAQTAGVFVSVPAGSNFAPSRFVKPIAGTYSLAGGSNGIPTTEATKATVLIGDAASEPKTGMQALDNDLLNIGIALVPGVYNQSVQNALITLAENTQNFLALVSPPYGIGTVQDAIDWSNGKSSSTAGSRTAAINSSYAAIYFPHIKVFSTFDGKDRWYDPTIFAARQMAYTDSVSETWFAPAGYVRGRLTKPTDVEVKLNQGDRDTMYSGGNVINPIVNFAQQGITIFGQRTSQRSPSALDRINIRRMMIYIRKIILASTRTLVFEPNDEFTWAKVEGLLNPFFDGIKQRRGITEFKVICDATTNTPERVDRNEMWCRVLIKPTKTAEIVVFELNLTNQSADLGTL